MTAGRYDDERGCWMVPVSDAWLNLLAGAWSEPVQLLAVTRDGGESYTIIVRTPPGGEMVDRIVDLVTSHATGLQDFRGDWNRAELRNRIEAIVTAKP